MYTQKGDIIILTWVVKSTNRKEKGEKKKTKTQEGRNKNDDSIWLTRLIISLNIFLVCFLFSVVYYYRMRPFINVIHIHRQELQKELKTRAHTHTHTLSGINDTDYANESGDHVIA